MDSDPDDPVAVAAISDAPVAMEEGTTIAASGPAKVVEKVKAPVEVFSVDSDSDSETVPTKRDSVLRKSVDSNSSDDIQVEKKRCKIVWQCIEPNCTESSREEMVTADSFVLAHYSILQGPNKKRKICINCRDKLHKFRDNLVEKVMNKQPITGEIIEIPKDIVRLEDSDNSETDNSDTSEFEIELSGDDDQTPEQKLAKMLNDCIDKFDFNGQITSSINELNKRVDSLKPGRQDNNRLFKQLDNDIEVARKKLFQPFESARQDLEPLDIHFTPPASPQPQNKLQPPMAQQQHRMPLGQPRPQLAHQPRPGPGQAQLPVGMKRPTASKSMGRGQPQHRPQLPSSVHPSNLPFVPPVGPLQRFPLTLGSPIYHLRGNSSIRAWKEGQVEELIDVASAEGSYKVKFDGMAGGKKVPQTKIRNLKQLAYREPAPVKLTVGTRCIGLYQSDAPGEKPAYYAGIIAEPPKITNANRYLIFFDDGVAQYIIHNDIRVVCYQAPGWPQKNDKVHEDIYHLSKEFIKKYLGQYPERPMVKLMVGQNVKAELEEKWHVTRVAQVDASLVLLQFDPDKTDPNRGQRKEWLYRGSTRLGPLFTELEKQTLSAQGGGQAIRRIRGNIASNTPRIEYTRQVNDSDLAVVPGANTDADGAPVKKMNVARKSMGNRNRSEHSSTPSVKWEMEGKIVQADITEKRTEGLVFKKHACSPRCVENPGYKYKEEEHRDVNTLLIPIILGWDRQVSAGVVGKAKRSKSVMYTAPCGRRLRNLDEVHRYLRITKSCLEIDFFNYDWFLKIYDVWEPIKINTSIMDLSYGQENNKISCVNSVDKSYPEYMEYSTVRIPKGKVHINTDPEFLVGCDCVDDCQDKESCACHQLTIQATACDPGGKINNSAGYKFRRLAETHNSGIYECNSNCKCAKTCLNRVVQHPLRTLLQVFKTEKRGWGVRTLTDIPSGAFICIYVGNLFESEEGNKQGQNFGDEYFADLDMIENCERRKDGYESDVSDEEALEPPKPNRPPIHLSSYSVRRMADDISTEEEDDTSGEVGDDREYNPMKKVKPRNTDRVSRSKIQQMDGCASTSCSEPEEFSAEPENIRLTSRSGRTNSSSVEINSMILKPDPFDAGMVTPETGLPGIGGTCSVLHPSQVDGALDDSDDDFMEENKKRPVRSGFSASAGMQGPKNYQRSTFKSTRKFFGHQEDAYIMDAKSIGNIGRYLNHCCEPNCFVQSVFIDTHDLRFHWVSFFSLSHISAGTELTWDYSYEVGTIPGKELYCECGAENCRGRLL